MGEALARLMVRRGWMVALVARREDVLRALAEELNRNGKERAFAYPHDVTNNEEVPALFQRITHDMKGFDTIVYCAGAMPRVTADEYNMEKDRLVYESNVMGLIAWMNQAAMRCETQESGTLVALSSVAGDRGRKLQPVYCSSKAAVTSFMEGLRNRLGHRGVKVVTIKPGPVKTPMTEGLKMPFMIEADEAARQILRAIERGRNTAYVPLIWWPIMTVIRCIPSFLFRGKNI